MPHITLFNTPDSILRLRETAAILRSKSDLPKRLILAEVLEIIAQNAPQFDELCQLNIGWIGSSLMNDLAMSNGWSEEKLELMLATFYRFICEFDLSVGHELSMELRNFIANVEQLAPVFTTQAQQQIEYARKQMPINIVKAILNSNEMGNLRDIATIANKTDQKIEEWQATLVVAEEKAHRLSESLENHANAFNFVGLHDGFNDLSKEITKELRWSQIGMVIFGTLVLMPSLVDLYISFGTAIDLSKINLFTLIAAGTGTITLTILLLYFFKITLRKADSCNAQLLQVRLRMSLCRFIQSYAEYSSEIKEKNSDALSKFEALIFSGIVGAEDKLPSTFDGLDQLGSLVKSIRGSKD